MQDQQMAIDAVGRDSEERITTSLRKGLLELCVLALLAQRDHYGLELADDLVGRGLTASEGSLYPLLARLRDAGAVETRWESRDGSRPRRYYAITTAGHTQLSASTRVWRQTSAQVDDLLKES